MSFIDVHAHLNDKKYGEDISSVVESYRSADVSAVVNSGYDIDSTLKAKKLSETYFDMYFTAGVHPDEAKTLDNQSIEQLIELGKHEKCLAIGEIGFDFYWNKSTEEEQIFAFTKQLEIADHLNLPVVIHSREASGKMIAFLKDKKSLLKRGFLMHCFSESVESAKIYTSLGAYFSFGGVITFKNAKKGDVLRSIPVERILTETDCPYLAPHPFRGQQNDPSKIPLIAGKISEEVGVEVDKLAILIKDNAQNFFGRKLCE